jgi:NitT/TauT family transport system ATP-binding protein
MSNQPALIPAPGESTIDVPVLEAIGLGLSYGRGRPVLTGVDLAVPRGAFVSIVGSSGTGKTSLLRCLAGLQAPTRGEVRVDGEVINGPPRQVAVVFQDYGRSLLPWQRVEQNVTLPLRSAGVPAAERRRRADNALESVGLAGQGQKYPWQLSGGMQQRVAIARALALAPEALLMDEAFASVDAQTRADLEDLILQVRRRYGMTVVLVTHDIDEAVYLSDEVIALGGSPTGVSARVPIPLGSERDQVETKALPQFAELRSSVLTLIRKDRDS